MQIGIAAIIVSNVHYPLDNDQQRMIQYFNDMFDGSIPAHEIRHRAAIKRSLSRQGSVFGEDAEDTDLTDAYLQIAESLEAEL